MRPSKLRLLAAGIHLNVCLNICLNICLGFSLAGAQSGAQTAAISPNQAESGQAFEATLTGQTDLCAPLFSRQSALVEDGKLRLSVMAVNSPTAKCSVGPHPYSVDFRMPALKAGNYEVNLFLQPECMYGPVVCDLAVQPQYAGILSLKDSASLSFGLRPNLAQAGKPFSLFLAGKGYTCADEYSGLSASAQGHVLWLNFTRRSHPEAICPAVVKDYGPIFQVPALPEGVYQVMAAASPYCGTEGPCPLALIAPQLAGALSVGPETVSKKGWFLKDKIIPPDNPSILQVLHENVGNCQSSFSRKSISLDAKGISLSFLVERDTNRVCVQDMRPYGPSFDLPGLKAGVYPVSVTTLLACEFTEPRCAVDRLPSVPEDTLIVAYTLSTLLSDLRGKAPQVEMKGSRAAFVLPEGIGGTWKAELVTVSGKRLFSRSIESEGGTGAELDLGKNLGTGVYLLRLQAPDGETHMLPVIRRE